MERFSSGQENAMAKLRVLITDEDGTLRARHEIDVSEIDQEARALALKHGELRSARFVLSAVSEVASLVTDEILSAVAAIRKDRHA